jgi:hypothetical protein
MEVGKPELLNSCKLTNTTAKHNTAVLCQQLAEGMADVAFIQEPWIYRGKIRGITNSGGTFFSVAPEGNVRSCIHVRNHSNALPLLEFCSRDKTMVTMTYTCGTGYEELTVSSAYFSYDSDKPCPTKELRDVTDYYHSTKRQLITGCDANTHPILWGNIGTNP